MQVERDDHTFSGKNCMEKRYTPQKQKSGHHFIYLEKLHHSKMNEQTIRVQCGTKYKDKYPESKTI
jgi:hypothetical protein